MTTDNILTRPDALTAVALLPFISFFSRRPFVSVGDAIEFALVLVLECRMLLSATGYLPLTRFEQSTSGVVAFVAILVALNIIIMLVPSLNDRL